MKNDTRDTVIISIRCDKQLKEDFVKVAMSLDRSLANYLKLVMKDAIRKGGALDYNNPVSKE